MWLAVCLLALTLLVPKDALDELFDPNDLEEVVDGLRRFVETNFAQHPLDES